MERKSSAKPTVYRVSERVQGPQDGLFYEGRLMRVDEQIGRKGTKFLIWSFAILEGNVTHTVPYFSDDNGDSPQFQRVVEALLGRVLVAGDSIDRVELYGKTCVVRIVQNGGRFKIGEVQALAADEPATAGPQTPPPPPSVPLQIPVNQPVAPQPIYYPPAPSTVYQEPTYQSVSGNYNPPKHVLPQYLSQAQPSSTGTPNPGSNRGEK